MDFNAYSTESLLLHLTETWKLALDKGLDVGVLFIDFQKTFDSVNYTILLEKLKATGISGDLLTLAWWLHVRMRVHVSSLIVQISGHQSESKAITYGVPNAQY